MEGGTVELRESGRRLNGKDGAISVDIGELIDDYKVLGARSSYT